MADLWNHSRGIFSNDIKDWEMLYIGDKEKGWGHSNNIKLYSCAFPFAAVIYFFFTLAQSCHDTLEIDKGIGC